jgi:hypothetical protein
LVELGSPAAPGADAEAPLGAGHARAFELGGVATILLPGIYAWGATVAWPAFNLPGYADAIEPAAAALKASTEALLSANQEAAAARDGERLAKTQLDNAVRTLHERARQLDREDLRSRLQTTLFPADGAFAPVLRPSGTTSARQAVAQLLERLESLGPESPLSGLLPDLQTRLQAYGAAIDAAAAARDAASAARERELRTRRSLCEQFAGNYYEAAKMLGRRRAESLFARFRSRARTEPAPSEPGQPMQNLASGNVRVTLELSESATTQALQGALAESSKLALTPGSNHQGVEANT